MQNAMFRICSALTDRTGPKLDKEEPAQVDQVLDVTQKRPSEWKFYLRKRGVPHEGETASGIGGS